MSNNLEKKSKEEIDILEDDEFEEFEKEGKNKNKNRLGRR
jgi:hypothetical protein